MAYPDISIITTWLVEYGVNMEYKSLKSLVVEVLSDKLPKKSQEELFEFSESIENDLLIELNKIIDHNFKDGIVPNFDIFSEKGTNHIRFIKQSELEILQSLRLLSPEKFEHYCKLLLDKMGANAVVEGGPRDDGVDFIGFELPINKNLGPSPLGSKIVVVGQAKRYKKGNTIRLKEVRSFIGSAVKRAYKLKRTHSEKVGSLHPIVYAFWTTSDFEDSAKSYAKEMGIWYLNGLAMSQLSLRIGIEKSIIDNM